MILTFLLLFIGLALLALSQPRHYRNVRSMYVALPLAVRQVVRTLGFGVVAFAGAWCVQTQGVALGLVVWLGQLTLAAWLLALLLSHRPRWLVGLLFIAIVLSALAIVTKGQIPPGSID